MEMERKGRFTPGYQCLSCSSLHVSARKRTFLLQGSVQPVREASEKILPVSYAEPLGRNSRTSFGFLYMYFY